MLPAKIKNIFYHSTTGIVLCGVILFLIGNTLYLQTVRDEKAEAIENLTQALEDYQSALQQQSHNPLLDKMNNNVLFGTLLKPVVKAFQETGKTISIQKISLIRETEKESAEFSIKKKRKKTEEKPVQILKISGQIIANGKEEPYAQLNEVLSQVQRETDCQFSLEKAVSDEPLETTQAVQFEISVKPTQQPECLRQFSRHQKGSN